MDDKAIRKILISYLEATNATIRIYEEKTIGSSVCDVMAVTDCLCGYEIKSDVDNYSRLESQIRSYDWFFDQNYLVVGNKHIDSAKMKVPDHWGILCIYEDDVTIVRKAEKNTASHRSQLSLLWKLELKNLLLKNEMPLYAQKDKQYIADQILATVPSDVLGPQIVEELFNRDYSVYDAPDYEDYVAGDNPLPAAELVDTLSEKDLTEFTLDKWIALYKQAVSVQNQKERICQRSITDRTPHTIPYTDIEVSLGAPWIAREIIEDFAWLLVGARYPLYQHLVSYEPITGNWQVHNKNNINNPRVSVEYGIERYNALYILEATLNLREIKLHDRNNRYDEKDTLAALEKQKIIQEEFKRWLWEDEDRRWKVEHAYNALFSKYTKQQHDGSRLTFPDMNPAFSLFPYQKDAVQKILESKNTLLAFDVGAGKTYIMIAAAMKMRQEGLSRKNMFVVPNHIVGQWEKIFAELFPKAKVLAIEPKSFKPEMRKKVLMQMRDGDYDGIIIAYSCFEMIPLSSDTVLDTMKQQLDRINSAVNSLRGSHGYISQWGSTPLRREQERIKKLTREFLSKMDQPDTGDVVFDDLEINTLFLDEAHNYKNLPINTKLKNLNGINTAGSNKCLDMLHKIRHIQQNNDGRGAVFATGTPLCNSIADAYVMQIYLQYDEMTKTHLDVFDNWVKTFARPEQVCEIDVDTSKYRFVRRFVKFFNLPELSRMFSEVAVFYALDKQNDLPVFDGYTDVLIEKYPELAAYMEGLCKRTEEIRSGKIDRKFDNMLKVSTDGRKAALDLKLVGAKQPYNKHSKIYNCIQNVWNVYRGHPGTTQLVFCDYSTPKGNEYNVYQDLKNRLINKGIPEKEIAFIHHYQTESRKVELFRRFNNGEVRVLLGSTFKLGIGANVQQRLKAVHHLDVPWRPADMVQREGRIIRRGNTNDEIEIFRYITQGSFDSYSWQILETKQRFISQFLSGSTYQRSMADLESNVLTYAEVKALALSEPLMKQLTEKENEIKHLRILIAKEMEVRASLQEEQETLKTGISNAGRRLKITRTLRNELITYRDNDFAAEYQKIKDLLTEKVIMGISPIDSQVLVCGFIINIPNCQDTKKPFISLSRGGCNYLIEVSSKPSGNARRIINFLKSFQKQVEVENEVFQKQLKRQQEIDKILSTKDNTYQHQLDLCLSELQEIKTLMNISQQSA